MIADVHLGVHTASAEWTENILSYFENFFIPLLQREYRDDAAVIIAGDFFESRQSIDINVLNVGIKIINEISHIMPLYMVVGNHDMYKKNDSDINSLVCFRAIHNVTIIDSPTEIMLGATKIVCIPWIGDSAKETKLISSYKGTADMFILHTEVSGMHYDNGRTITEGTIVKGVKGMIYSGHIHKHEISKNGKTVYIGSPYHTSQSDIGNQKGVYILDASDNTYCETFIPNTYSPIYMQCTLGYSIKTKELIWSVPLESMTNNYVYITIKKADEKYINTGTVTDMLTAYNVKRVEFEIDASDILPDLDQCKNIENASISEVFDNVTDTLNLEPTQIEAIKALNTMYMQRAAEEMGLTSIIS